MLLYLVRHAEPKREEEDPTRPLSEWGLQEAVKVGGYLCRLKVQVDCIYHSPKLRSKQTAEVLRKHIRPLRGIAEAEGLTPMDDPQIWLERLKTTDENLMLVGHLPHLGKLATLLLCDYVCKGGASFPSAATVCLKRDSDGVWSLQWMVTPAIIP